MAFAYKEPAIPTVSGRALGDRARGGEPVFRRIGLSGQVVMMLSLVLADALAAQAAFYLGAELYRMVAPDGAAGRGFSPQLATLALVLPAGYGLLGIYGMAGQAPIERFPARIKATCVLFALLVGWHYATQHLDWPLGAAALTFAFAIVLPLIGEAVTRTILIRRGLWSVPAVVIGAGPTGQQVVRVLKQMPELGLRPVGFFDDRQTNDLAPTTIEDLPLLGPIADSAQYSRRIETAIVTTPADPHRSVGALAMELGYRNIIVVPDLRELPTLWVRARDLNGLIGLQMRRNLLLRRNRLLKQTIDYLIALPLFVVSVPFIAVLSLWIMAVSKGSPFYTQLRAGKNGRPIKVWKLRTMYPDAEEQLERYLSSNPSARLEWERFYKLTNDPRILPGVGHFLRRSSLDELPQIFNVIRGEMSLVGPRPLPQGELDRSFDPAFQSLRSSVIPGITGLWQVSARSDGDQQVQQTLDTYYIRNWSIWIDFYILSRTLGAVLAGRGAR